MAPLVEEACCQLGTQAPGGMAQGGDGQAGGDASRLRQRLHEVMQAGAALSHADLVDLVCGPATGGGGVAGGQGQEAGRRLAAVLAAEAGRNLACWVWTL